MVEERARFIMRTNPTNSWTIYNPVLRKGEIGIEETSDGLYLMKIGDGSTPWNNLPYAEPFTDKSLTLRDVAADAWAVGARINSISERIQVLEEPQATITNFTCTPSSFEIGNTVTTAVFNWTYDNSENVISQQINNIEIPLEARTYTLNSQSITQNTTFTLTLTESNGTTISKAVVLSALPTLLFGASTIQESYTNEFLQSLSNRLYDNTDTSVSLNAGSNSLYCYIAYPYRYGTKLFFFNNIKGGFQEPATVSYTNQYNYTENYYVYRSDYPGLGALKINIRGDV